MRQTLLHLALILLALVALTPEDPPPDVSASTVVQLSALAVPTPSGPPTTGARYVPATLEDLVRDAGLPSVFVDIARCESGPDPAAVHLNLNGSRDHGLWQINDRWWRQLFETLDPYDPVDNAAMAALVYAEQGLGAWEPSRHCWEPAVSATTMAQFARHDGSRQ